MATQTRTSVSSLPLTAGRVLEQSDDAVHLGVPGTEYRLHLALDAVLPPMCGQRIEGVIHARAKRVDVMNAGGRFVEPVFGKPRRLQGRIIGGDAAGNKLYVHCGGPVFVCELTDERQQVSDFAAGQMVGFDIETGAKFEPA